MLQTFLPEWNQIADLALAALLNSLPAMLALTVLVWILLRCRRNWTAASKYWTWWITLTFAVSMPVAHLFLSDSTKRTVQPKVASTSRTTNSVSTVNFDSHAVLPIQSEPLTVQPKTVKLSFPGAFLLVWLIAATFQFVRLGLAFRNNVNLKRSAAALDEPLQTRCQALLQASQVRRPVVFGLSDVLSTPAVLGYCRPFILLPGAVMDHLSAEELDQVLLHELAHVRRYDDWVITIQRLIETLFMFHPVIHFTSRRIELEREVACDDWVLSTKQPRAYASCLTRLAEFCLAVPVPKLMTSAVERSSQLSKRIEKLLDRTRAIATRASLRNVVSAAMAMLVLSVLTLRLPRLMAYPLLQLPASPAAPQPPTAPQPPAVPESHPASQPPPAPEPPAAPQEPSAPQAPDGNDSIVIYSEDGTSYMYGNYGSGNLSVRDSRSKAGTIEFRRHGKLYVIRDQATVHAAEEILRPQQELGRRQAELGEQQAKLGEAQAKLGSEQAKLAEKQLNAASLDKLNRSLKRLQDEVSRIKVEEDMKTASDAQSRIAELQAELAEMQSQMGEEQSKSGGDQSRLGEQQSKLGEQQSRLGEMQSKLGEEQSRLAKEARKKLNYLIDRAMANGLAQPVQ